ncbi:chromate efflux transporter [Wenxinia marina]|uniref:Chromate transporter, chromate ion transporter (CHR) family n=1 Tax=Wenxinia marina DSM 24838 TaxID=1123501 RepID=A0A0D0NML6_9RHOB|nr:chromate efflux transporter [Wenxinia marina]KIQ69550.1 chromate transporter, chromate ion transporter (CHR) family [Wenxinia marina DSM 24838]GGL59255.1 hypothetical protein GCM10011392_12200 [Wenxinia marina]
MADPTATPPPLAELTRVFGRIGCVSFGGPAAQMALMHHELVERRAWLGEAQYLRGLGFCMLLPGPEAMQLATYAGWRLRGVPGGLIAGGLFVLPGALVILVLALLYGAYGTLPGVQAAFLGVKAAVLVIVAEAVLRIGRRALGRCEAALIAVLSLVALSVFGLPFPLVIAVAGAWGALRLSGTGTPAPPAPAAPARGALTAAAGALVLWWLPVALAWAAGADLLYEIGRFFSLLAVLTFGGAYAVLAWLADAAVGGFGWLSAAQMIDALGLAETTPGPLILVTEFVAILAGLQAGGVWLGLLAGAMCLWVTFAPCFLWIFAFAPFLDRITAQPRLQGALNGITAAVVGVIASLGLWFGGHVLFGGDGEGLGALDPFALVLTALGAALLLWRHWPLPAVLGTLAAAGLALGALG